MQKHRSFVKIIAILLLPCILFISFFVSLSKNNLYGFFYDIQKQSLNRVSGQTVNNVKNSVGQVESIFAFIEQKIILCDAQKDKVGEVISLAYNNRQSYVKGIVFFDGKGNPVGEPSSYWYNFADQEKSIIKNLANNGTIYYTWSNTFYSTLDQNKNYDAMTIVAKAVYSKNKYIGKLAMVIDLTSLLSNVSIYGGNYDFSAYLYQPDGRLADLLNVRIDNDILKTPAPASVLQLQNYSSAVRYLSSNNSFWATSLMDCQPRWSIIIVGDVDKLKNDYRFYDVQFSILLIAGFAGIFAIYLIVVLAWFTRPLSQLSRGIRQVGKGNFDYQLDIRRNDEFGDVAKQFNFMSKMVKELIEQLQVANAKKKESDLNILLSQINPHFLYNTLNAIDIMVDIGPKENVHEAFGRLVGLLKYGLNKKQFCSLNEELEYVENYIALLKIRYGNLFEYRIEKQEDLGNAQVLKLIIQPLVENAIFHGLQPLKSRKGELLIRAYAEESVLFIEVRDNGVGIPAEKLNNILEHDHTKFVDSGIGISNVYERIQLYFGSQYGLQISSAEDQGTDVILRMPKDANLFLLSQKPRKEDATYER